MLKRPCGCPAEIWKGTSQEADKRSKHAPDHGGLTPVTWGLSRGGQGSGAQQTFRSDSLGCSSLTFVSNGAWVEIRHLEDGLQPVFKENTRECLFVSRLRRKLHQDGHEGGDRHWKNTQQIKTEFWHWDYISKESRTEQLRCHRFLSSFFFWWQNGITLGNLGKVIISRRTFYKLYELPTNSINRDSKYPKSHMTNGFKF